MGLGRHHAAVLFAAALLLAPAAYADEAAVARGAYLAAAGGCTSCHTDAKGGAPFAGGAAIKTPLGSFYAPNITPDRRTGIGGWSLEDFTRAMTRGTSPRGRQYYPAFPYTSYTRLGAADLADLKSFLDSLPPVETVRRPHDIVFIARARPLLWLWKQRYLNARPLVPEAAAASPRGAYLVEGLGHCAECHTPRDVFGGLSRRWLFTGTRLGGEMERVPNITPGTKGQSATWSASDFDTFFIMGLTPDGDVSGGGMARVIAHATGKLTAADRAAMIAYLKALPPKYRAIMR